jgi:hypothetical protein
LLHHFEAVPLYFPVVAGWFSALAVLIDFLFYALRNKLREPKWLTEVLRVSLEGLSHVHAFPVVVLAIVVELCSPERSLPGPWLTILVMALVAILAGLSATLMKTRIEVRTIAERWAPIPYFVAWTVGLALTLGLFPTFAPH